MRPRIRTAQLHALTTTVDECRATGLDSVPIRIEALPHGIATHTRCLVIGSRGLGGFRGLLFGSTGRALV
ncbi:hypothetical protein ACH4E7_40985, partial [Kitasatospora sp. NPDC018058]